MRDELLRLAKRVVIKIGNGLVASRETGLSAKRIDRLACEIADVRAQGREVLIVSSRCGGFRPQETGLRGAAKSLPVKQAAAAVAKAI